MLNSRRRTSRAPDEPCESENELNGCTKSLKIELHEQKNNKHSKPQRFHSLHKKPAKTPSQSVKTNAKTLKEHSSSVETEPRCPKEHSQSILKDSHSPEKLQGQPEHLQVAIATSSSEQVPPPRTHSRHLTRAPDHCKQMHIQPATPNR